METTISPVIAVSNKAFPCVQEMIEYCMEHNLSGIDYTLNSGAKSVSDLERERATIEKISEEGFEIRYHLQFFSMEIAHADVNKAKRSFDFHKDCLEFISSLNGEYATIHIGLGMESMDELRYETALAHLSDLVSYGREKSITLCLENLTKGWANNPHEFLEMIEESSAGVTFDIGHANACPWVMNNQGTSMDFLRTFSSHVINAHIYEIEKIDDKTLVPYHVAPQRLDFIRPLLSELLGTKCDWWLIELKEKEEVNHTRTLLQAFLKETQQQTI